MPSTQKNRTSEQLELRDSAILSTTETKREYNPCLRKRTETYRLEKSLEGGKIFKLKIIRF